MLKKFLETFNPENHLIIWLICAFILAFFIAFNAYPTILFVAKEKHLIDEPDDRSTHSKGIPTLGGVGIFLSLIVVITITGAMLDTKTMMLIMGAITILFFLGLKDDLTILSAKKKFVVQLAAALLLIVFTDTRIFGFSNILGVEILPYWVSIVFTLFVYILIINAYNLIDGIDGLAGVIACFICGSFLVLFIIEGETSLATICAALMGALVAFLRLNLSSNNKIFMGDTGSMIVGFLIAFFAVSFISHSQVNHLSQFHRASPTLVFAILFYPLIDTLRIVIVRIVLLKKSPFKPDRNHIHHGFLNMKFSHLKATIIITVVNFIILVISYSLLHLNLNIQIALLLIYGSVLYLVIFLVKRQLNKGFNFKRRKAYQSLNP